MISNARLPIDRGVVVILLSARVTYFVWCGVIHSVQYFEREAEREGKSVVFSLYRCVLQTHERRWYISIVPSHRKEPGTSEDMDFYFCNSQGKLS